MIGYSSWTKEELIDHLEDKDKILDECADWLNKRDEIEGATNLLEKIEKVR